MLKLTGFILLLTLMAYTPYQEKRLLLLFADKPANPLLKKQQEILRADEAGLKERDIKVRIYYADKDAGEFHNRKINSGFTVILIGKDGGEKLRSTSPLSLQKLYNTIDAMPMRQQEMKNRPKNN